MKRIEIEFDVYKMLTAMLETEQTTYSDVIRRLARSIARKPSQTSGKSFLADGVEFPHETEFRMRHKGRWFTAKVLSGCLIVDGRRYSSVSKPACEITHTSVNGWKYWECRFPGDADWQSIDTLRHRAPSSVGQGSLSD
ncbi:MAG: hypothetical protein ABSH14_03110 [Verrucomicrobiia bacterium]|jgi:hypothetical protein